MEKLSPDEVDYRAFRGSFTPEGEQVVKKPSKDFNGAWTNAMMKPRSSKVAPDVVEGYAFNNVSDSISKTFSALAQMLDLEDVSDNAEEAEEDEAAILNA